jgi:putative hemolysin
VKSWVQEIKESTLLRWNGINKFLPKISFSISVGPYLLKTAESPEELVESCRLRYDIFYKEYLAKENSGIDVDRFDSHFDHLIIIHKETNKVIGTYRVNCSTFSSLYYSEQEFDLTEVLKLNGSLLELGRACIHKDYRKSASVISLLWRGITEYMNISEASILFGCSSIKINNPRDAALIYKYLIDNNAVSSEPLAWPTKKFQIPDFDLWSAQFQNGLTDSEVDEAEKLVPALLKSYLKFGAKVVSIPAFDKDLNCVDLLTVLKKIEMNNTMAKRFSTPARSKIKTLQ